MRGMKNSIKLALSGVVVITVGRMSAAGHLPRNMLAGIRIPSTLRSDDAWQAGHAAAATALTVAGLGPIAAAAVVGVRRSRTRVREARLADRYRLAARLVALATVQARNAARGRCGG